MGIRQREWARKKRDELRKKLGYKCAQCGYRVCFDAEGKEKLRLEFDLIIPGSVRHHEQMEFSWRMSFYSRQLKLGNLQLLCGGSIGSCHNKKTSKENYG